LVRAPINPRLEEEPGQFEGLGNQQETAQTMEDPQRLYVEDLSVVRGFDFACFYKLEIQGGVNDAWLSGFTYAERCLSVSVLSKTPVGFR